MRPIIDFEYHGRIRVGWATSAVEARGERVRLVVEFVLALCLLVVVLWYLVIAPRRHRRFG